MLWESADAFYFRTTNLVSAPKSHSSGVRGLVVRCLPFNQRNFEPVCMRQFFLQIFEAEGSHFFGTLGLFFFRLCETFFRTFYQLAQRILPSFFLIFCNKTNV